MSNKQDLKEDIWLPLIGFLNLYLIKLTLDWIFKGYKLIMNEITYRVIKHTVGVVALGIVFKLKLPEPFQDNEKL